MAKSWEADKALESFRLTGQPRPSHTPPSRPKRSFANLIKTRMRYLRSLSDLCGRLISIGGTGLLLLLLSAQAAETRKPSVLIPLRPLDSASGSRVSFQRDIRPILLDACVECHSTEEHKAGLDVSTVDGLKRGGKKDGPGVIPGKPDESPMVRHIRGLADAAQMPKGAPALNAEELHLIRQWIAAGALDDSMAAAKTLSAPNPSQHSALKAGRLLDRLVYDALSPQERFVQTRRYRVSFLPDQTSPPGPGNPIDAFISAKWREAKLPESEVPPALCDDSTFARRAYLDLTGLIPPLQEAQAFVADPTPDKRTLLIERLLSRTNDYAAHWTPFWEDALGSSPTDINGGIGSRGNHRQWILDSFMANKPFDLFVAELIDPTLPGYRKPKEYTPNGRHVVSGYIKNETHEETLQSAANVSQVFLGTGMKCASCHSHFLNKEWPQARFMAFAGMFAPGDLELIRCETRTGQRIPAKFPFELDGMTLEVPTDLNNRLHRVAQMLVDPLNPRFSKSIVNRLFKRYLGLGLIEPADDFRSDLPASHPELLEWLAQDLVRHDFDLRHTLRWILTSRTYQTAYRPERADRFDILNPGNPRYFRSPTLRRLTAEQWLDSIRMATRKGWKNEDRAYRKEDSTPLTRALGKPAARSEVSTARPDDTAVVQSLELLNGPELHRMVSSAEIIEGFSQSAASPEETVQRLYWLTLSRMPSAAERARMTSHLSGANGPKALSEAIGDILWVLFVSPEFQYIR